ncbi:helix-turn-helix domain-containing protein [Saccharopolyspora hattusasensis]|uniref:helix-turn-helix domain-containing protein n=1 Tax=Saccharopolyspora hattusasensis TaxID=1128679 RepID=UPI003D965BB8
MKRPSGPIRTFGLGAELRKLREEAGLSLKAAAAELDKSESWLSRSETGDRSIGVDDVSALLSVYGVRGSDHERLLMMARNLTSSTWWTASVFEIPAQLAAFQTLEARATRITMAAVALVPGLLQTVEYARALVDALEVPSEDRPHRVSLRIGRQIILSQEPRKDFVAYLDEAVLHHMVGGRDVIRTQLLTLLDRSKEPNITIRAVPFSRGAHTLLDGSFTLFEFSSTTPVCYLEERRGSGAFFHEVQDVEAFEEAAIKLDAVAADEGETRSIIERRVEELDV